MILFAEYKFKIRSSKKCDLTVYNYIVMQKNINTKKLMSENTNHQFHSSHLLTKPISSSTTIFASLASPKTYNELQQRKIRFKTQELSLEKLPSSSTFVPHTFQMPRRAKCFNSDVGLRQTEDSLQQIYKKKRVSIQNFMILKELGKGKHGIVYLALHKATGFVGALKVFQKQNFHSESSSQKKELQKILIRELKIQSYLQHTNILKVYCIFSDQKRVYLLMQLGSDGQLLSLLQRKKSLKEQAISFILRSLLEAIKYLHGKNILHRDLKPQNIVMIHGFPKICDFGQSTFCNLGSGELRQTLCGTPLYLSPQLLKGELYNQKADLWAFGAIGYELYTGTNPFNIKKKQQLKRVITENFQMTTGSVQFSNFINYCLRKKPSERPSADKLLKHPFIRKWVDLQTSQQLCN